MGQLCLKELVAAPGGELSAERASSHPCPDGNCPSWWPRPTNPPPYRKLARVRTLACCLMKRVRLRSERSPS